MAPLLACFLRGDRWLDARRCWWLFPLGLGGMLVRGKGMDSGNGWIEEGGTGVALNGDALGRDRL